MKRKQLICLALLFVASSGDLFSQVSESDIRFSSESTAAYKAREGEIEKELRTKHPAWAGEYYYGDGLGVNVALKISPHAGFVFTWNGCLGQYDLNYGEASLVKGTIELSFKHPNSREGFQGLEPELFPVTWGERHYLIPVNRMVDFANAVNAGTEPAGWRGGLSSSFLLKSGDGKRPISGRPGLPAEYMSYLLEEPVQGKISSIKETRMEKSDRITVVTLAVGSESGLKEGMEFYVRQPKKIYATGRVSRVEMQSSEVTFVQSKESGEVPAVGWKLSTKL